jgi:hypothetical protein
MVTNKQLKHWIGCGFLISGTTGEIRLNTIDKPPESGRKCSDPGFLSEDREKYRRG